MASSLAKWALNTTRATSNVCARALSSSARALSSYSARSVSLESEGILDGNNLILHHESRYLCRCPGCFGATSNQPLHTDDFSAIKVTEIKELHDHYIELQWDDGHVGMLPRNETGAYGNGYKQTPPQRFYDLSLRKNKAQTFWSDGTLPELNKKFDYEEVISCDENVKELLAHYMQYGLALLANTPNQPGDLLKVLDKLEVGPYWKTLFGLLSRVSYQNDPLNQAFNNQHLAAHTDMPYYTQTPSVYFFHCVANELEGGESFWVDTFSALHHMRTEMPEMFEILAEVKVPFRQYRVGWHMAGSYPTIEMMGDDMYRTRDCNFVIDNFQFTKDYDPATRARWWEAYNYLRAMMTNPDRSVQVKLQSGDLAIIDNWRVQHGRNQFTVPEVADGAKRVMDVVYVEWSHVQNRLLRYH